MSEDPVLLILAREAAARCLSTGGFGGAVAELVREGQWDHNWAVRSALEMARLLEMPKEDDAPGSLTFGDASFRITRK